MEKTHCINDYVENNLSNIDNKLFNDYDPIKDNMNDLVPLPICNRQMLSTNNEQVNCPHSIEISSQEKNGYESDELVYDSDCSLGSTNSLYLLLKNGSSNSHRRNNENKKCLLQETKDASRIVRTSKNKTIAKSGILENRRLKSENDKKLIKEITTMRFYGKQESIRRHNYSIMFKCKSTELSRTYNSNYKCRTHNRKLHNLLKNRKYESLKPGSLATRKMVKSDKVRNPLKKLVPQYKLNHKALKEISHNYKKYLSTTIVENRLIHYEKDSITDNDSTAVIKRTNLSVNDSFSEEDFMDSDDDFRAPPGVDDIIQRLSEEDLSTGNDIKGP